MEFDVMNILMDIAVILLATKLLGMLTRKLGLPQVVGMILAGLLIGPAIFSKLNLGGFSGSHPSHGGGDGCAKLFPGGRGVHPVLQRVGDRFRRAEKRAVLPQPPSPARA